VVSATHRGPTQVRLVSIGALGRVGDATCLAPLLDIAVESDPEISKTAKEALADLPGDGINKGIVARLAKAEAKTYPVLIELVGQRRIEAIAELQKALNSSDRAVRSAALTALGNTVPDKYLSVLITQVVSPTHTDTAAVAQQGATNAAGRMADREVCAAEIAAAMNRAPAATKSALLDILAAV